MEFTDGQAQLVEFTVTNPRFRVPLSKFTTGMVRGHLGRQSFSELSPRDRTISPHVYSCGARRFFYAEREYIGNPGGYCTVYLAINDAGAATDSLRPAQPSGESSTPWAYAWPPTQDRDMTDAELTFFAYWRRTAGPNSVAVAGPGYRGSYSAQLVDLDSVRLLDWPAEQTLLQRIFRSLRWRPVNQWLPAMKQRRAESRTTL